MASSMGTTHLSTRMACNLIFFSSADYMNGFKAVMCVFIPHVEHMHTKRKATDRGMFFCIRLKPVCLQSSAMEILLGLSI